ncbi:hypothetical protein O181_038079 [Austropuccinia psidii MF-1]|uniref:Uncharacterized protein n=1 Tax=Austropuccinia psidii MF-1 TaxID=1389203 RepID=A0A9Q3D7N1_9BASI|nr:hypothetical protein [Austropuccinia psidii MF-1]
MIEKSNTPTKQQETTVIDDNKDERAATIAEIKEWGNWKHPQISPENKNFPINFGLRQTKQRSGSGEYRKLKAKLRKKIRMKHKNSLKEDTSGLP